MDLNDDGPDQKNPDPPGTATPHQNPADPTGKDENTPHPPAPEGLLHFLIIFLEGLSPLGRLMAGWVTLILFILLVFGLVDRMVEVVDKVGPGPLIITVFLMATGVFSVSATMKKIPLKLTIAKPGQSDGNTGRKPNKD